MSAQEWDEFMRWNDAIMRVCYPEVDYPEPAYLDLDDDIQVRIADELDVPTDAFAARLADVVRAILIIGRGKERVFSDVLVELRGWRAARRTDDPPPVLPLQALLSLAAEQMSSGDGIRETNYYSRLVELLGVPNSRDEIAGGYRLWAETLWGSLNDWLTQQEGRRGTPTATQVGGHRYVGIPISQALIRRAERQHMLRFFIDSGLPVGAQVADVELAQLFSFWIGAQPCPAPGLARLWGKETHRERVLEALQAALAQWDGRAEESRTAISAGGRVKLALSYSTFPRRALTVVPLVYLDRANELRRGRLAIAEGLVDVDLVPAVPGGMALGEGIDSRHLLESVLQIEDPLTGQSARRMPGRLVVFRKDERTESWIETEGIMMGEELRLVCRADLVGALESVLSESARPGWHALPEGTSGVPAGWQVLLDVQMFAELGDRLPPGAEELSRLHPIASTQLVLAGGLRLPRAREAWHAGRLPELRAICQTSSGFRVLLIDLTGSDEFVLEQWNDDGSGQLVVDLAKLELATGRYRIELRLADETAPVSRTLSVHDADSPLAAPGPPSVELVHDLDDPLTLVGVFRNWEIDSSHWHEGGETSSTPHGFCLDEPPPKRPAWSDQTRPSGGDSRPIQLRPIESDSCLFTGAHRWDIDQAQVDSFGRPMPSTGRCTGCGLEQTYSNNYYRNRRKYLRQHTGDLQRPRVVRRTAVESVRAEDAEMPWDCLLDALVTMGSGSWSDFLALARQVDGSGPAVFHMAHTLEALGHVEISRDASSLEPLAWTVTRPALVDSAAGQLCVGRWTPRTRRTAASAMRARIRHHPNEGPTSWCFSGASASPPDDIASAGRSWERLAAQLPPLSEVIAELPRRPVRNTGTFRWFHVASASWVPVDAPTQVGAYRLRSFSTLDVVRDGSDLAGGTMAVSQVRLSKHAAALLIGGQPLLAFDPTTLRLTVPLGADLPGLYNRAVVLATGGLPHKEGRTLVYENVPADLASHLHHLLKN